MCNLGTFSPGMSSRRNALLATPLPYFHQDDFRGRPSAGMESGMEEALTVHRLQFAFTITFHYIFPQLTMGLALLILILKTAALRTGDEQWNRAARFWARIFGISFAFGIVTG